MKVRASVKPMCEKCKIIKRKDSPRRVRDPKHKQRQGRRAVAGCGPREPPKSGHARSARRFAVARIAGVDLPREKRLEVALHVLYGFGRSLSKKILAESEVSADVRVKDLTRTRSTSCGASSRAAPGRGDLKRRCPWM